LRAHACASIGAGSETRARACGCRLAESGRADRFGSMLHASNPAGAAAALTLPMATPPTSLYTLRATFAYKGRSIRFAGSQRVAMMPPPAVTPPPGQEPSGTWFEVRDAAGTLLFHRALHDPVRSDVEVHQLKDAKHTAMRVRNVGAEGQFEVLVPDLPEA